MRATDTFIKCVLILVCVCSLNGCQYTKEFGAVKEQADSEKVKSDFDGMIQVQRTRGDITKRKKGFSLPTSRIDEDKCHADVIPGSALAALDCLP